VELSCVGVAIDTSPTQLTTRRRVELSCVAINGHLAKFNQSMLVHACRINYSLATLARFLTHSVYRDVNRKVTDMDKVGEMSLEADEKDELMHIDMYDQ